MSGDWRPYDDYRTLNQNTVSGCYLVPHLQDFTSQLQGKQVFSRLDLVRAYRHILGELADVLLLVLLYTRQQLPLLLAFWGLCACPLGYATWHKLFSASSMRSSRICLSFMQTLMICLQPARQSRSMNHICSSYSLTYYSMASS